MAAGDHVVVEIGAVAHGGHCVARHAGRVLFVRHGLPGETARVQITEIGRKGRFLRADVVDVLVASPDRRAAPCPVAATCGGCDWQHASVVAARRLKEQVVRDAMDRFAGITLPERFTVESVDDPGPTTAARHPEGLGWRTRGTLSVVSAGAAGFRAHRSHRVVVGGQCPQLHQRLDGLDLFVRRWPPNARVGFVAPSADRPRSFPAQSPPGAAVVERAAGRTWEVAGDGFWQVHPGAADALVTHVRRILAPRPGERLVDLYAGVGLFGLTLGAESALEVTLVEGDRRACALARRNAGEQLVTIERADVSRWVRRPGALADVDLVVLDPPRTGAGAQVTQAIGGTTARRVAYVACDPVALARDVAAFQALGFALEELVALDLFPTTHHVECVAWLERR